MIDIQHISKSFDGRVILDDISLVFEEGKTNLVIGSSGSGKTVLMKCLVSIQLVYLLMLTDFLLTNGRTAMQLQLRKSKD